MEVKDGKPKGKLPSLKTDRRVKIPSGLSDKQIYGLAVRAGLESAVDLECDARTRVYLVETGHSIALPEDLHPLKTWEDSHPEFRRLKRRITAGARQQVLEWKQSVRDSEEDSLRLMANEAVIRRYQNPMSFIPDPWSKEKIRAEIDDEYKFLRSNFKGVVGFVNKI